MYYGRLHYNRARPYGKYITFMFVSIYFSIQQVMTSLQAQYTDNASAIPAYFDLTEVTEFVSEMARLAWKMVIQVPPLNFDASQVGDTWDDDGSLESIRLESKSSSDDVVIQYYKAPTLMHGHVVLVKGSVFVQ